MTITQVLVEIMVKLTNNNIIFNLILIILSFFRAKIIISTIWNFTIYFNSWNIFWILFL